MGKRSYFLSRAIAAATSIVLLTACTTLPEAATKANPPTREQVLSVGSGHDFNYDPETKKRTLPRGWHLMRFRDFMADYAGTAFVATRSSDGHTHRVVWPKKSFVRHIDDSYYYIWKLTDSSDHILAIKQNSIYIFAPFFVINYWSGERVGVAVTDGKTIALWYEHSHNLEVLGDPVPLPEDKAG